MPTAIVTGASRGLGLALATALRERRWRVVADARQGEAAVDFVPGDVADPAHRARLVAAAGPDIDLIVNNASTLGPTPLPPLVALKPGALGRILGTNVVAPLALIQEALPFLAEHATIVNVTSDAAVEAYETWGGYGTAKAALDQLSAVLAAEHPELHVYAFDPGDMRTRMQQEAFPGEDISDRPLPEEVALPGLLALLDSGRPSGRYRANDLVAAHA